MPQLARGGKYVFGWSRVMDNGRIVIPPEAVQEYKISPGMNVILISGSKTSGGFIIAIKSLIEKTPLGVVMLEHPELRDFQIEEGKTIEYKRRKYLWTTIQKLNTLKLDNQVLEAYGIKPGDDLLSVRGSYIGITLGVKGPLIEHAKKHPEVKHFN